MPRRPSGIRRLLAVAALAVVLGVPGKARGQISPGDLSRAHRELEGSLNCMSCHGGEKEDMDGNCTSCHGDIAELVRLGRGLHARTGEQECAGCHPEHAGRDFRLIDWDGKSPESFDHRRAGWPLAGKHADTACRDCHRPEFQVSPVMALSKRTDHAASWVGLETDCSTCHRDPHDGALGTGCASCHGVQTFRPATAFDHERSDYPLTGKHAGLECAKCHLAPGLDPARDEDGRPVPLYKPLAHAECSACHDDPHQGRLGAGCAECHSTDGFRLAAAPGAFNHAVTRFPLRGRHASLECRVCHDPVRAWGKRPAFDRCDACHADAHAGTATISGKPADCAACHDETSFARSTFTAERHRDTDYPLEGKHAGVRCRDCHARHPEGVDPAALGTSGVLMRPAHDACRDCHPDSHAGQVAGRPEWADCAACHGVEGFKPSRFGVGEHATLRLPLEGRHAEVGCSACHGPERPGLPPLPGPETLGSARVLLAIPEADCASCHHDPHRLSAVSDDDRPAACAACHDMGSFRPSTIGVERHREYAFSLEGAHQAVPCFSCHEGFVHEPLPSTLIAATTPMPEIPFDRRRTACTDCHEDPHGGQFTPAAGEPGCEHCHGQDRFRPATNFEHDRDTRFALRGSHAPLPCRSCHDTETFPDGVVRVRYRPTPRECAACHVNLDRLEGMERRPATPRGER